MVVVFPYQTEKRPKDRVKDNDVSDMRKECGDSGFAIISTYRPKQHASTHEDVHLDNGPEKYRDLRHNCAKYLFIDSGRLRDTGRSAHGVTIPWPAGGELAEPNSRSLVTGNHA